MNIHFDSRAIAVHALSFLVTSVCFGQSIPGSVHQWPPPPQEVTLKAVLHHDQVAQATVLGGGREAKPEEWPASYFGNGCTWTLIGPRVLLGARHCIADGGTVYLKRDPAGVIQDLYTGKCSVSFPKLEGDISADWALCALNEAVVGENIEYEVVDLKPSRISKSKPLHLAGYGCQKPGMPTDEKFREGFSTVNFLPGYYASRKNWIETHRAIDAAGGETGAYICEGDSGGAVYVMETNGRRFVVAVNSHRDAAGHGISFLSVISSEEAKAFIEDWRQKQAALGHVTAICGLDSNVQKCRD